MVLSTLKGILSCIKSQTTGSRFWAKKGGIVLRRLTGSELVPSCDKKGTGQGPIHPLPSASSFELTGGEPATRVWQQVAYEQKKLYLGLNKLHVGL
jgi:hypothetical protein